MLQSEQQEESKHQSHCAQTRGRENFKDSQGFVLEH